MPPIRPEPNVLKHGITRGIIPGHRTRQFSPDFDLSRPHDYPSEGTGSLAGVLLALLRMHSSAFAQASGLMHGCTSNASSPEVN